MVKAAVGFIHAGEASREAVLAALERRGYRDEVPHLVDASLVDAGAAEFPIDERRYAAILGRAREMALRANRIVLSCSVYNGVASFLRDDLQIPVDRSDAAGARSLLRTQGPVGILVSYPPTRPLVVDYVDEVLAGAEQSREVRASVAPDAPPFATAPEVYRDALVGALGPLRGCGVLFLAQYSMSAHLPALRAAWGDRPLISAVDATVDELFPV